MKSTLQVIISPVPEFARAYKTLQNRAKQSPPDSQLRKTLATLNETLRAMRDPNYRGHNDVPLERELDGYRKIYVNADDKYRDPKDGAQKASHRLVYEEYLFNGKLHRSPIVFDTRDRVYGIANGIIGKHRDISVEQIFADNPVTDNEFAKMPPHLQQAMKEKFSTNLSARANAHYYQQQKAKTNIVAPPTPETLTAHEPSL